MADFRHWHGVCMRSRDDKSPFGDDYVTKKTLLKLAAAAIAFAAPSLASATTMTIAYNAASSTIQNVSVTFNGLSGTTWATVGAGRLAFDVSAHDPLDPVSALLYTFCIEPTQYVSSAATVYSVDQLKNGNTTLAPVGLGAAKASLINQLFARNLPVISNSLTADAAAALQFAIWEIVGETTATYNVTSGSAQFQMTTAGTYASTAAHTSAVASLANSYLSALTTGGPQVNGLFALDNNGTQDQVAQYNVTNTPSRLDVPEPATLGLFGFGALAMGLRRRKAR